MYSLQTSQFRILKGKLHKSMDISFLYDWDRKLWPSGHTSLGQLKRVSVFDSDLLYFRRNSGVEFLSFSFERCKINLFSDITMFFFLYFPNHFFPHTLLYDFSTFYQSLDFIACPPKIKIIKN